jgi:hypothetical protein
MARNVGIATALEVGPAKNNVDASVAGTIVMVPAVVTGEPVIVKSADVDRATDVTVPLAAFEISVDVNCRNVGTAAAPLAGPASTVVEASVAS